MSTLASGALKKCDRLPDVKNEEKVIASIKDRLNDFCENAKRESPNCPFVVEKTMVKTGHPVDQIVRRA